MAFRYNTPVTSGNLDTVVAGTVTAASTLLMRHVKEGTLSAHVVLDVETDGTTVEAVWQVSNNGSTWIECAYAPNSPAVIVLATGTAGADASVTRSLPAPPQVYGHLYARIGIINRVNTGAAVDTYAIGYTYRT